MFKICFTCKEPYKIKPSRANKSFYCSKKCHVKGCQKRFNETCAICDKTFSYISFREGKAKFCSQKCYQKSRIGKELTIYQCLHCHINFKDSASRYRKYCSKSCVNKCTKAFFIPKFTTVRRQMVRRNLIEKCEICGYNEEPKILGIHHIDKNRENNKKENLQVLCPNCHSIVHLKHISHVSS